MVIFFYIWALLFVAAKKIKIKWESEFFFFSKQQIQVAASVRQIINLVWPYEETFFYDYGAEIPIEEIPFPMAILNGHLESFYDHIW